METNVFSQVSVSAHRVADGLCPEPIRPRVGTIRPPPCVWTCFARVNWNANHEWVVYFPWASSKVKTCMCNFHSISCQSLLVTGPHTGPWNIWKVPHWQSKRVWLWNIPTYTSFTFIVAYVLGINFKRKYSAEGGGWWSKCNSIYSNWCICKMWIHSVDSCSFPAGLCHSLVFLFIS